MIRMTVLLGALLLGSPGECLFYKAPDKATPDELAKAAQAMTARCKDHGYKGIQASVVDREGQKSIQVNSDSGFTPAMKSTLNEFAQLSGSAVELRFSVTLTDVEKEQYQPSARTAEDKAPPGTKWYRAHGPETSPVLLRDAPLVTKAEILQREAKDREGILRSIWEISQLQTRELRELERKSKLGSPYLLMDGWVIGAVTLNDVERNAEGRTVPADRMSFVPSSRMVREALLHPMAFPLEIADGAEEGR